MCRYVAFLRAINVGNRYIKMEQLRALFTALRLENVTTFIASGNVVFDSGRPAAELEDAIERHLHAGLGFDVATMLRSMADVASMVRRVEGQGLGPEEGTTLYVGFLKRAPSRPAATAVAALSNGIDELSVDGRELFWRSRPSFSDSTINGGRLEKLLGVPATLRNFNTVHRLAAKFS